MNSQIKNKAVYWGTGRRKTSVARVRLIPGNGLIKINGRSGDDYLNFNPLHLNSIKAPLQTLGLENSYDILVNVFGGGLTGQADAICNGEVVMTTGSTQPELHVDVWSGNHPFFTGTQKILDTEGRVDRFMKKYGMGSANSATSKEQKEEKDSKK